MARDYFPAYHAFLKQMEQLSDAERGRLFTALLTYSSTGEVVDLRGCERVLFPVMRERIDRDREQYEAKCEKNRENILRRYTNVYDRIPSNTTVEKEKERDEREREKREKEPKREKRVRESRESKENPLPLRVPPAPGTDALSGFSPLLREAVEKWLRYKAERREKYKPTGEKAFLTRVSHAAEEYGDAAVAELIEECMASNWQGVIFDRLRGKPKEKEGGRTWAPLG